MKVSSTCCISGGRWQGELAEQRGGGWENMLREACCWGVTTGTLLAVAAEGKVKRENVNNQEKNSAGMQ